MPWHSCSTWTSPSRRQTHDAKADPFCTVFWNGRALGKTYVVNNNNNPKWLGQSWKVPLPVSLAASVLRVELRDFDGEGVLGDLLGQVELTGQQLMSMARREERRCSVSGRVLPHEGTEFQLGRKELNNEKQYVQGALTLKVKLVELTSCVVAAYRRQAAISRP